MIGALHAAQNHYAMAETAYTRALAIWEFTPPNDELPMAEALANLALVRQVQGRNHEAIDLYRRAIPLFDEVLGSDNPSTQRSRSTTPE